MTNDETRHRFEQLLAAKKQARSGPHHKDHPDGHPGRPQPPKTDRTFRRRKV